MARLVVLSDDQQVAVLDERDVKPIHLISEQSARQLLQRVAWAVEDAERCSQAPRRRPQRLRTRQATPATRGPFE